MKNIKVRYNKKTNEHYLRLSDFKVLVDIKKVSRYTLETVDDGGHMALILTFYDKNGDKVGAKE